MNLYNIDVDCWLTAYKQCCRELLETDPEFRCWLEEEYVPIAGGWQY
jgi:hypothetical protein